MRRLARTSVATIALTSVITPAGAVAPMPAQQVGPPFFIDSSQCPLRVAMVGGRSNGAAVPIRALQLRKPAVRAATSATTGGSLTGRFAWEAQRAKNGLPPVPKPFDKEGRSPPVIFAEDLAGRTSGFPYQRLPITVAGARTQEALVFAVAASATTGLIAAVALTLPQRPAMKPLLSVSRDKGGMGCVAGTLNVYAPSMTPQAAVSLFSVSGCGWWNPAKCLAAEAPRGTVLFVYRENGGGWAHRWIDYDLIVKRLGPSASRRMMP